MAKDLSRWSEWKKLGRFLPPCPSCHNTDDWEIEDLDGLYESWRCTGCGGGRMQIEDSERTGWAPEFRVRKGEA